MNLSAIVFEVALSILARKPLAHFSNHKTGSYRLRCVADRKSNPPRSIFRRHRAESFCLVRVDRVTSAVTLFHLAGLNVSKENEISYVEVDYRDTSVEVHYYHKGGRNMVDYKRISD